jgi:uncharacterized membrane protein YfcA
MGSTEIVITLLTYIGIGAFAGLMAGILGIGGGVIVVPGLLFVFEYNGLIPQELAMHTAAATSLAIMILTSQSSLRAHLKINKVLWSVFFSLSPGIIIGTISGALLANIIPTEGLKILFAIFLFLVAIKMITDVHVTHSHGFPSPLVHRLVSFLIGLKSGLLGVGGGVLIIPYLTYCGVAIRQMAAISNLCTLTVACIGTFVFIITGWQAMQVIPYATGYVYWPAVLAVAIPSTFFAPVGARLSYTVPQKQMKYGFIVILLITASSML